MPVSPREYREQVLVELETIEGLLSKIEKDFHRLLAATLDGPRMAPEVFEQIYPDE